MEKKPYVQYRQNGKIWQAGRTVYGLCAAYNHATNPSKLMTESEHQRSKAYAKAIRNRMTRLGFVQGAHYKELTSGSFLPMRLNWAGM